MAKRDNNTVAKNPQEFRQWIQEDYSEFLKRHSDHPDDHLDLMEWFSENSDGTVLYGWRLYKDGAYDYKMVDIKNPERFFYY